VGRGVSRRDQQWRPAGMVGETAGRGPPTAPSEERGRVTVTSTPTVT